MAAYKKDIGNKQYENNFDKIDWKAKPKKKVEREMSNIEKTILSYKSI